MEAIRLETIVEQDGRIIVPGIRAGDEVEVIVLRKAPRARAYPLRTTTAFFPAPFDPVIPGSDWDSNG